MLSRRIYFPSQPNALVQCKAEVHCANPMNIFYCFFLLMGSPQLMTATGIRITFDKQGTLLSNSKKKVAQDRKTWEDLAVGDDKAQTERGV